MIFDVNNPNTFFERCVAAKANDIYGTHYSLADARFDTQTFRFYNGSEYIARLVGPNVRFDRRGYLHDIDVALLQTEQSDIVEEWEHHNTQSVVLMNITKETTVGDVAIVPEHRCDNEDTQAQLASQFMQAYGIDTLIAHKYNGYVLTFRKVD
jgi:hypothetical protein